VTFLFKLVLLLTLLLVFASLERPAFSNFLLFELLMKPLWMETLFPSGRITEPFKSALSEARLILPAPFHAVAQHGAAL
jgi:hypothetical protein